MADRVRKYNEYVPFDRPRMPRNKYGLIDIDSTGTSSALFGTADSAANIGIEMPNIDVFRGATKSQDGTSGLVPAPVAGKDEYFLQANGNWVYLPAFKWIKEWPEGAGFEKSGITVKGNLNVADTISTVNLKVEGAAHFWSLIIDKVKSTGGQLIVSPGSFHVDYVGDLYEYPVFTDETPAGISLILQARPDMANMMQACHVKAIKCRRLYMNCDDGTKATENECQVGDMLRCRSFNVAEKIEYHNISNKDYWTFVCKVDEEEYTDADNKTHKAFYVDVAYCLRLENGKNLPLGTKLKIDGTYELPDGYTDIADAVGLKSISNRVLTGNPTVDNEFWDTQEFQDITNKIINIRGFEDQINDIVGV